ncbi:MAG TPA: methyltransferase domain-containing protein, partial [Candidatus Tectomicrobia bacterium]|nr:methyltransferase domain-containing protein [Candidatus Tectomicrobia bacterium]
MTEAADVRAFYDRHPINEAQVLDTLRARGRDLARLAPEDLFDLDQDHYGGVAAVEALARRAAVGPASRVLDVCAGLGGPARFVAHRFGARVVALDLNTARVEAARRLTRAVHLEGRVVPLQGDAQRLPFRAASFTAVLSQEGLLHVPDKASALREAARVLVPGGRIAFTDWVATPRLEEGERRRLAGWMAAVSLQTVAGYRALLGRAGFVAVEAEDLSAEWIRILRERLVMYRGLRPQTEARFGRARADEYDQLYAFFVGLVEAGRLGGARFSAT